MVGLYWDLSPPARGTHFLSSVAIFCIQRVDGTIASLVVDQRASPPLSGPSGPRLSGQGLGTPPVRVLGRTHTKPPLLLHIRYATSSLLLVAPNTAPSVAVATRPHRPFPWLGSETSGSVNNYKPTAPTPPQIALLALRNHCQSSGQHPGTYIRTTDVGRDRSGRSHDPRRVNLPEAPSFSRIALTQA